MKPRPLNFPLSAIFIVITAFTSGCVTFNLGSEATVEPTLVPSPTPALIETVVPEPSQPALTQESLLNMAYLSPMVQQPVQLVNGEFSGVLDGVELNVKVRPEVAFGDLNNDGVEDAALLISENTGGSGIFVSLIVVHSQGDHFRQAPGVLVDDRPIIDQLVIDNGLILLEGKVHGPNDPMVDPTMVISAAYRVFGEQTVLARLTSSYGGGDAHMILIDEPSDGEEVSAALRLIGNMPIGPFENNLSLTISDTAGNQLVHEGFMVQAADMGAPATFDNPITLPTVNAGAELLVMLSELSMADGTPMAIDSVVVKVK